MANKTYFKGKKKSTVKSKKYQFAGFDEATQIDNTGYLNALYNPKYFDKTGNSEVVSREASKNIESNKNIAYNTYQSSNLATNTYEDYNRAIENQRKQSEDAKKELQQKTKAESLNALNTNVIQSVKDPLLNFGKELVKKQVAKQVAKNATVDAAMQSGTTGILQSTANPTTAALTTAQSVTGSTVPAGVEVAANTTQAAATAGTQGAVNATTTAGSSAAGLSSAAYSGIAALGTLAGEGWKYLSNDQDPGTYTKKEKAGTIGGTILSRMSTGAGIGATAGSLIAPVVGTGIGALIGGAAGAVGGTVEGLIKNKKFKRQAEEIKRQEENERLEYLDAKRRNEEAYNKQLRLYDYTRNKVKNDITYQSELLRQNRLMGLTEGQLAGNTNIAMTGGGRKYFGKGGVNVPGGQVVPIGQGAVEFVGRKHSQGGIMLDPQTEVEGGETMDKVMMTGGKFNDYFFSDYLKNGGKSFAQHHKELIKRGASQEEIQALAKKQEAMANRKGEKDRSPKQVAEYGGLRKYQTGNFKETTDAVKEGNEWVVRDEQGKILGKSMDKNAAEKKAQNKVSAPQKKNESTPATAAAVNSQAQPPVSVNYPPTTRSTKPVMDFDPFGNNTVPNYTPNSQQNNTVTTSPNSFSFRDFLSYQDQNALSDAGMPPLNTTQPANSKFGPYKNLPAYKIPNNFGALGFKPANSNPKDAPKDNKEDAYSKMYSPEQIKTAKILAGIGFGSQMIAPVSSIFMKPNLVSAPTPIVPGMIDTAAAKSVAPMISAGKVEAPRLGRVTPETEDIMNRDVANRQFFSNIGDPSSMIAMIASTGKTNEAERKAIADAQRTNVELAGKEGMLKFEASKANVASSLEAQRANQAAINEAQGRYLNVLSKNQEMKNQAYLANLDAQTKTRLANAQLLADKQNRDIAAMSTFGTNVAGGVGDFLSYGIEGEKSRMASGDTGVYERNFIPLFGTNKSKTGEVRKKMYGGTNSYTSRLGDLKFKRALKVK